MTTSKDGSLNSAQAEAGLRERDIDLAKCDKIRLLLLDAWPKK